MKNIRKVIFIGISILSLHGCATPKAIHCSDIDEEIRPINAHQNTVVNHEE